MPGKIKIYTDGGARGNPGPAGIGVVFMEGNKIIAQYKEYIGHATNNQAEYRAVILALLKAHELGVKEADFYLDSELVVNQLKRKFKVKNKELASLFIKAWNLIIDFRKIDFFYIPREENKLADRLVNEALDEV